MELAQMQDLIYPPGSQFHLMEAIPGLLIKKIIDYDQ
jgi:hypothetical protein